RHIQLDRRAANEAEHFPLGLRPALALIEPNAMDGGDLVADERAEGNNQRGQKNALAVAVRPGATMMIAQHAAGEISVEREPTRAQIVWHKGAAGITSGVPNSSSPPNALGVVVLFPLVASISIPGDARGVIQGKPAPPQRVQHVAGIAAAVAVDE